MDQKRRNEIERFVRDVLGCLCHDEVFRSIEAGPGPELGGGLRVKERLVIGHKLLIYLVDSMNEAESAHSVEMLVKHGIRDRDEHGLNRFRLVFALDASQAVGKQIQEAFRALVLPDERIHLHIVPLESLP